MTIKTSKISTTKKISSIAVLAKGKPSKTSIEKINLDMTKAKTSTTSTRANKRKAIKNISLILVMALHLSIMALSFNYLA